MNTQTLTQRRAIRTYIETQRLRQPEPVNFCAEPDDTDSPLPAMLLWAVAGLVVWAMFGWGVVELVGGAK